MNEEAYPDTAEGVRAMMLAHDLPVFRVKRRGVNIWMVEYKDGSTTMAFPTFGMVQRVPFTTTMTTLCDLREPQAVIDFIHGPDGGESAYRPQLVAGWARSLCDEDGPKFWAVIVDAWPSFDRIPHDDFALLFGRFAASVPSVDLPDRMKVYRGQNAGAPNGLSWTLNREVADGFARGHRGIDNNTPAVLEMEITRDQVTFVCHERDEAEVVLWSIPAAPV